jgi:hypothetical protein
VILAFFLNLINTWSHSFYRFDWRKTKKREKLLNAIKDQKDEE